MKDINIPDFGAIQSKFRYGDNEIILEAKAIVPGLTLQDLVITFGDASSSGDNLSGNPSNWNTTRGVEAVVDQILQAIYSSEYKPCKCD